MSGRSSGKGVADRIARLGQIGAGRPNVTGLREKNIMDYLEDKWEAKVESKSILVTRKNIDFD
jgi:hypothetical protein